MACIILIIDSIAFLVENFEDSLLVSRNKFAIFCVSIFIHSQNQTTVAAFCEDPKVVSSDFSMMKNIVAPSSLLSFPMKLICCFKSGFSNSIFFA